MIQLGRLFNIRPFLFDVSEFKKGIRQVQSSSYQLVRMGDHKHGFYVAVEKNVWLSIGINSGLTRPWFCNWVVRQTENGIHQIWNLNPNDHEDPVSAIEELDTEEKRKARLNGQKVEFESIEDVLESV